MADHHEVEEPDVSPSLPARDRRTAPQSAYGSRDVLTGFAVLAVGLVVTFGLAVVVVGL